MFYYVEGPCTHKTPALAVIDCGGVGFALNTTANTLSKLTVGKRARLYTFLYVREDIFDLYGFYDEEELRCFKMLLGISGVGPKAALSILSASTPEKLALSILTGDMKVLTVAPGIGKKLAQRIVLELKDKIAKEQDGWADSLPEAALAQAGEGTGKASEVLAALAVLGYSQTEAAMALKGVDVEGLSVEECIKQVLKKMVSG